MGSPDGNGSSTGEGRNAALLLLRGGRRTGGNGSSERGSTLPSSNALRPDSNLNLGWYRPATPDDRSREPRERDESSSHDDSGRAGERQSIATAATTRLDLSANQASCDLDGSALGARRPRDKPGQSEERRTRESGRARVGLARLPRLTAVGLGTKARELRRRPAAMAIAAALLVAVAAVSVLNQPGPQQRGSAHIGSAVEASQFQRDFLSKVATGIGALSGSDLKSTVDTAVRHRSRSDAHRRSEIARARGKQSNQPGAVRISRRPGHSTPVSHAAASSQSNSQRTPSAGSDSGTTAPAETPAQSTPSHQTQVQQTSTQQPVQYQPPAQPAGPTGLGSQVGSDCNPKCS